MSEVDLFGHVRSRADALRAAKIAIIPAAISPVADRWLLASLLQKAVRRGQSDIALGVALTLLQNDPARLWRRLMTIALEDVGVGDLAMALDIVAISSSAMTRKLLGGAQISLEIVVPLACRAVKDRTGDHLASLVRWERHKVTQAAPDFDPLSWSERSAVTKPSSDVPAWRGQVDAASLLAGAWESGRLKFTEVEDYFGRQGAPRALVEACGHYARRCGDPLFIYLLAGWAIRLTECPEALALARLGLEGRDLGELPDYSLDPLRTRLGRRAIELWLRSYLDKPPFDGRQVMAGLWNAEAALCNQTLFWKAGGEIQKAAYQADLLVNGLVTERHVELSTWLTQEASVLFTARQMVWQSHVRGMLEAKQRAGGWHQVHSARPFKGSGGSSISDNFTSEEQLRAET